MTLVCMAEWQEVQRAERERVLWIFKKSVKRLLLANVF